MGVLYLNSKESSLRYRLKNREKILERQRLKRRTRPLLRLVWNAKRRAKEKGLEFNLTDKDLVPHKRCPYLDLELHYEGGKPREDSTASLDRIDNSKGYIKGNVEVISDLANRMKNSASLEQLVQFAKVVIHRFQK